MMTKLEWVLMMALFSTLIAAIVILDRGTFCTVFDVNTAHQTKNLED